MRAWLKWTLHIFYDFEQSRISRIHPALHFHSTFRVIPTNIPHCLPLFTLAPRHLTPCAIPASVPSQLTSAYALHGMQPWNSFQHEAEQRLTLQSTQCSNPAFCGARCTQSFFFSLQCAGLPPSFHFHTHHWQSLIGVRRRPFRAAWRHTARARSIRFLVMRVELGAFSFSSKQSSSSRRTRAPTALASGLVLASP